MIWQLDRLRADWLQQINGSQLLSKEVKRSKIIRSRSAPLAVRLCRWQTGVSESWQPIRGELAANQMHAGGSAGETVKTYGGKLKRPPLGSLVRIPSPLPDAPQPPLIGLDSLDTHQQGALCSDHNPCGCAVLQPRCGKGEQNLRRLAALHPFRALSFAYHSLFHWMVRLSSSPVICWPPPPPALADKTPNGRSCDRRHHQRLAAFHSKNKMS